MIRQLELTVDCEVLLIAWSIHPLRRFSFSINHDTALFSSFHQLKNHSTSYVNNIRRPSVSFGPPHSHSSHRCHSNTHRMIVAANSTSFALTHTAQLSFPQPIQRSRPFTTMSSSPLVSAFTPAEKEALSKFKAEYLEKALAEVSSSAGSSSPSPPPEIWNVEMDKEDPRRDVIIVKFLRAKYPPPTVYISPHLLRLCFLAGS